MRKSTLENLFEEMRGDTEEVIEETSESTKEPSVEEKLANSEDRCKVLEQMYANLLKDFNNVKRQCERKVNEANVKANEKLISDFLPILDDFSRAKVHGELSSGVGLIYDKFNEYLSSRGLKKIDTHETTFDIDYHEAIGEVSVPSDENGKIVDCIQDGYLFNDKVIRYAKVLVGKYNGMV